MFGEIHLRTSHIHLLALGAHALFVPQYVNVLPDRQQGKGGVVASAKLIYPGRQLSKSHLAYALDHGLFTADTHPCQTNAWMILLGQLQGLLQTHWLLSLHAAWCQQCQHQGKGRFG